jgi:hypothetical protein
MCSDIYIYIDILYIDVVDVDVVILNDDAGGDGDGDCDGSVASADDAVYDTYHIYIYYTCIF